MRVPFSPESLDTMRARFEDALKGSYRVQDVPGPAGHRRHIFDFAHGLRLVVSFDKARKNPAPILHVVASFSTPGAYIAAMAELRRAGRLDVLRTEDVMSDSLPGKGLLITFDGTHLRDWLEGHFHALCQWKCPIDYGMTDGDNAYHFIGPDRNGYRKLQAQAARRVPQGAAVS